MPLRFDITGDNSNFLSSLEGARQNVHRTARDIEQSGLGIEDMFKRIGAAAGLAFSLDQAKSFIGKVAEVRAYFQDIESTMKVFLGNEQKATQFTEALKDYAYYNMYEFSQLADASKQMIAYGHSVDTVIPRLDQLSNIATGTNADLMELVDLYNRAKNLGEVGSQGLASWATKGLVVKDVLKEMGEEVKGSTVTFEQLNKVLDKVTGEGGMFHNLMLEQMENISAEQGQLQDNLDAMYNEIGEKYQDYITGVYKAESWMVDHYKEIAQVIADVIVAYGSYKGALMAANAIEKIHVMWVSLEKTAHLQNVLATEAEIAAKGKATVATVLFDRALKALNATLLANPYSIAAVALSAVAFGIYKLVSSTDDASESQERLKAVIADTDSKIVSEQDSIDHLFNKLRKAKEGTEEYKNTKEKILSQYGKYLKGLNNEISTLKDVEGAYKAVAKAAREASIARGKDAALKEVQDNHGKVYSDNISKLQEALNKRVGEKKATSTLTKIQKELRKTGTISAQTENEVRNLLKGTFDYGNSGAWITGLRNNERNLSQMTKLVEERFQLEEEENKESEEDTKDKKKDTIRNKEIIEEERKNLKEELENLDLKEAKGEKGRKIKEKIKKLDKELNEFDVKGGSAGGSKNNVETRSAEAIKAELEYRDKLNEIRQQSSDEQEKADISAERDRFERERKERKLQHDLTLRQIEDEYQEIFKTIYEIRKKNWENTHKDSPYENTELGKLGWRGVSGSTLNDKERALVSAAEEKRNSRRKQTEEEYTRFIREQEKEREKSLNDYYKEYGTREEKRAALVKEYEEQIKQARSEGDMGKMLTAQAQMLDSLRQFDADTIKENLNWDAIFSDITNYDLQFLTSLEKQLQQAMKDGIEQGIDAVDLKAIGDKLQEAKDLIANRKTGIFDTERLLGGSWMGNVSQTRSAQRQKEQRAAKAQQDLLAANQKKEQALRNKQNAQMEADFAEKMFGKGSDKAKKALENLGKAADEATQADNAATVASEEAVKAQSAAMQGAKAAPLAITDAIIHGVNDNLQSANTMFQEWGIGSEEFRQKFALFADSSAKATQAFDSLKQGDVFGTIYNLGGAVSSLGESLGLWSNSNVAEKEAEIEARENANKELVKALQDLTKAFKNSDLSKGVTTFEKALSVLNSQIDNARRNVTDKMDEYDGHHSTRYYSDDATHTLENLAYRAAQRGVISKDHRFSGNENINWIINEFTPEELAKMRAFDASAWTTAMSQLRDADKAGLGATDRFVAYVDEYATAVKDLERQWKETVTNLSWDSLKSSFSSALNDMTKNVKDWSNDVDDIFRSNVSNYISTKYTSTDTTDGQQEGRLTKWYDKLAEYTESAGLDAREAAELRSEYLAIQQEANAERDRWYSLLDLDDVSSSEAQGTINGIKSISDDTGNEIVGGVTATRLGVERGNIQREELSRQIGDGITSLRSITEVSTRNNEVLNEILDQQVRSNGYLYDIVEHNKNIYSEFGTEIRAIRKKLETSL